MRIAIDRASEEIPESSARTQGGPSSTPHAAPQPAAPQPAPPADLVALQRIIHGPPIPVPSGNVPVQRASGSRVDAEASPERVREAARLGTSGPGGPMPHLDEIRMLVSSSDDA